MTAKRLLGIDLGGTSIKFGLLTPSGHLVEKWAIPTDKSDAGKHIVPSIITSITQAMSRYAIVKDTIIGIGMGSPGVVDYREKTVTDAFNLNWTSKVAVGEQIEQAFNLPFAIDNDANVAALGERWLGAGDNQSDVVFITLGTGVGGGVIAGGRLIRGFGGSGGEIGHMPVEPENGFLCTCGNRGCLETVASATGIVRLATQMANDWVADSAVKQHLALNQPLSSQLVFQLAEEGDGLAKEVVARVATYIGVASANIANILNPAYIVIGGGVSAAGEFLRRQVETQFLPHTYPQVGRTTHLKIAELGSDAGIIGAASLVNQMEK